MTEAEVHFEKGSARGDAARRLLLVEEPRGRGLRTFPVVCLRRGERAAYFDYLRSVDGTLDVVKRVKA